MGNAQLGKQLAPDDVENIVAFLHSLSGKQPRVEYPLLPASTETTRVPRNNRYKKTGPLGPFFLYGTSERPAPASHRRP
ncbi:Cytochrome c551 peroxidase [Pseudomonas aeruginosa]|nr:Cytochrome c551 peroxidase [Pseudomonas aeruginosa]